MNLPLSTKPGTLTYVSKLKTQSQPFFRTPLKCYIISFSGHISSTHFLPSNCLPPFPALSANMFVFTELSCYFSATTKCKLDKGNKTLVIKETSST